MTLFLPSPPPLFLYLSVKVLQYICFMCLSTDLMASKPQDLRAKLAHDVPFKVAVNIFPPDRLVQTASYMPESQLHLHSCNNELVNPALLEKAERLESIRMDWEGEESSEQDSRRSWKSFPKLGFICMSMHSPPNPSGSPAQPGLLIWAGVI